MELEKKSLDVVWSMTSITREQQPNYHPIRIPLLKGLLGHRIFIIREEDKALFSQIKTLEKLRQFTAGQGDSWPDYYILKNNNISVVGSSSYEGLFKMLERKRFDYFPRGVMEPWVELETRSNTSLVVDKHLMLYYPTAFFYFVHKDNHTLFKRIEQGLTLAIKDGSFDTLLNQHPYTRTVFQNAAIETRRIFHLKTKLSPQTQAILNNPDLWFHSKASAALTTQH